MAGDVVRFKAIKGGRRDQPKSPSVSEALWPLVNALERLHVLYPHGIVSLQLLAEHMLRKQTDPEFRRQIDKMPSIF